MRLFVGVWPSDEVRAALAALSRPADTGVRWTPPEQWHVTLRFLGEVADEERDSVVAMVRAAAVTCRPTVATLGPATRVLGRVLVAPVAGLDALARALHDEPFTGHLTLARVAQRNGRVPRHLAGEPVSGAWPVDEIALVRSHLGRGPARYETISRARLTAGAIAP